jgi:hypothetical protein
MLPEGHGTDRHRPARRRRRRARPRTPPRLTGGRWACWATRRCSEGGGAGAQGGCRLLTWQEPRLPLVAHVLRWRPRSLHRLRAPPAAWRAAPRGRHQLTLWSVQERHGAAGCPARRPPFPGSSPEALLHRITHTSPHWELPEGQGVRPPAAARVPAPQRVPGTRWCCCCAAESSAALVSVSCRGVTLRIALSRAPRRRAPSSFSCCARCCGRGGRRGWAAGPARRRCWAIRGCANSGWRAASGRDARAGQSGPASCVASARSAPSPAPCHAHLHCALACSSTTAAHAPACAHPCIQSPNSRMPLQSEPPPGSHHPLAYSQQGSASAWLDRKVLASSCLDRKVFLGDAAGGGQVRSRLVRVRALQNDLHRHGSRAGQAQRHAVTSMPAGRDIRKDGRRTARRSCCGSSSRR